MGWVTDLFGGSSQKTVSDSKTQTQRKGVRSMLDTYLPTIGQGQQSYPKSRVAPLADAQQQALSGLGGFLQGAGPTTPQNIPLYNESRSALSGIIEGVGTNFTPEKEASYIQSNVTNPYKELRNEAYSGINENFAEMGMSGLTHSDRGSQKFDQMRKLGMDENAAQQRAALDFSYGRLTEEAQKNEQALAGVGVASNLARLPSDINQQNIQTRQQIAQFSGVTQQQAQNELNDSIQRFLEENRLIDPEYKDIIMQLLGMNMQYSVGTADQNAGEIAGWASLGGRIGGMAAGAAGPGAPSGGLAGALQGMG